MRTFVVVDAANLFFRSRHVVRGDIDDRVGLCAAVMLNSIKKIYNTHDTSHVVLALEGSSWRKTIYKPYKANRKLANDKKSVNELEEDKIFYEAFDKLMTFFKEKTNVTVLQNPILEGDDLIAGWVQQHPNDNHIIVSSDTDFIQLVDDNIDLYDGMKDITYKADGIYDKKGVNVDFVIQSNAKIKVGKPLKGDEQSEDSEWRDWYTFLKIIRGDPGDGVFSAYPGARLKGTKNKIGIREAFEDRSKQGFDWTNFMLHKWADEEEVELTVLQAYKRNTELIGLSAQPDMIKGVITETIQEAIQRPKVGQVGLHFMKLCGQFDMPRVSESAVDFGRILSRSYSGE